MNAFGHELLPTGMPVPHLPKHSTILILFLFYMRLSVLVPLVTPPPLQSPCNLMSLYLSVMLVFSPGLPAVETKTFEAHFWGASEIQGTFVTAMYVPHFTGISPEMYKGYVYLDSGLRAILTTELTVEIELGMGWGGARQGLGMCRGRN